MSKRTFQPSKLKRARTHGFRARMATADGRCFSVRYRPNGLDHPRMGLAISKRVSKRAVDRNRIKRLVRESFRRHRLELPPIDLMVMAREQAVNLPGPELLDELQLLWKKLRSVRLEATLKPD